jgi:hypothetical protein
MESSNPAGDMKSSQFHRLFFHRTHLGQTKFRLQQELDSLKNIKENQ